MKSTKTARVLQRDSNIELLRVVAMLMIIVFHIFIHAVSDDIVAENSPFSHPVLYKRFFYLK